MPVLPPGEADRLDFQRRRRLLTPELHDIVLVSRPPVHDGLRLLNRKGSPCVRSFFSQPQRLLVFFLLLPPAPVSIPGSSSSAKSGSGCNRRRLSGGPTDRCTSTATASAGGAPGPSPAQLPTDRPRSVQLVNRPGGGSATPAASRGRCRHAQPPAAIAAWAAAAPTSEQHQPTAVSGVGTGVGTIDNCSSRAFAVGLKS